MIKSKTSVPIIKPATPEERFWAKVRKTDTCWIWTSSKTNNHYGKFRFEGKTARAHRVAYQLCVGPIPPGLYVCHHCDTPACVRPSHLFSGTDADNKADSKAKGRRKGRSSRRLLEAEITEVRQLYVSGVTRRALAEQFGVSQTRISSVIEARHPRTAVHEFLDEPGAGH